MIRLPHSNLLYSYCAELGADEATHLPFLTKGGLGMSGSLGREGNPFFYFHPKAALVLGAKGRMGPQDIKWTLVPVLATSPISAL